MANTGRLTNIFLRYRKLGRVDWKYAYTLNDENELVKVDYIQDPDIEDDYGYLTLEWNLKAGNVAEGPYEIAIETQCTDIGGPSEFLYYRETPIKGVLDWTRPKQYGNPLPLRNDIIVGEEIAVVFSEPLDCSFPFSFDMQVTVFMNEPDLETLELDKDNLKVICEGRKIGFQLDLDFGLEPSRLIGKKFEVEIGQIGPNSVSVIKDVNENEMDLRKGNIKFEKRFGPFDLSSASTSFVISMKDVECSDEVSEAQAEDIRSQIAS